VPFAYYHVLKLLLIIALALSSYALIELEHAQIVLCFVVYAIFCIIMIGLQSVAVAMSDPFGTDDLDFDLERFLATAYDNAVALITEQRAAMQDRLPSDMQANPLNNTEASKRIRTWSDAFGDAKSATPAPLLGDAATSLGASLDGSGTGKYLPLPDEETFPEAQPREVAAAPSRSQQSRTSANTCKTAVPPPAASKPVAPPAGSAKALAQSPPTSKKNSSALAGIRRQLSPKATPRKDVASTDAPVDV